MPSSFSFLLNSPSNSSSSSSENVSKSDQSDDDDGDINVKYYKKRTIQTDNDMLECPSDHDDSCSQSDVTDNDEHDEKKHDHFTSSNNPRSIYIARQATLYNDEWPRKSSIDENKIKKATHNDEATLAEIEPNDTLFLNSNQHRVFSPEQSKSGSSIVDKKYQSRNIHTPLPSDFITTKQDFQSFPEPVDMKTTLSLSQNQTNTITSPMNKDTQRPLSKIPIRANSSSQSRSRSPALTTKNRHVSSPKTSSKIPVPVSTTSKGAFHFFNADDRSSLPQQQHPTKDSVRVKNQITNKQASPFTPITHRKTFPSSTKTISSAGNTPTAKYARKPLVISDDDEDSETNNLKEDDLKLKLKEQKRYGKKTEEILDQLHENYEELLEKYAQAENTIDQLRFQPKIYSDYTPSSNASEGTVHFIHQPKVNVANLRANGIYHSTSATPLSSIMRATSATISTPAAKSTSPANSVTIESVFFDESSPQKIIVEELTTPETVKLDLLIQTKTLGGKMKSFITLMDANQLSLAEQKQVYETIKDDYEKLLKVFDRTKRGSDFSDIDFDADLNTELEMMKQLLKEIVTRITDNLLGKSSNGLDTDGQSRRTHSDTHSSQVSARSSICNHTDLMDQYHKLLNAVNAGIVEKKKEIKPLHTGFETGSEQVKKTPSHVSSQSDIPAHLAQTTKNEKQYIYRSGNSDDEQQQRSHDTTPVQLTKDVESTSFGLDHIPSTSNKHHQQINDEQPHLLDMITATKKIKPPSKREIQQYDNLENITKSTRKIKTEQQKIINHSQPDHELSPPSLSFATGGAHYSTRSMRTRTSDYDSGIGTNNTTKLSRDSKLNTTMMDETHYQSLDEDRRRYTDEEQESMSSVSTSCSSGSGVQSPGISYDKYTKRFDTFSSSRTLNENSRRKPNGHSDVYPSDLETHITGSFDTFPQPSANKRKPRHSHPNLQTQQTISHRSRSTPFHRRTSIESIDIDNSKNNSHQPQETAPHHHKMGRKYQTGFIHRQPASSTHPQTTYRSACYIDQPHTHRRSQEKVEQNQRQSYKQVQPPVRKPADNLYLDPQTGIVYQYVSNKSQPSTMTHYQPNSQVKPSNGLYQCPECGCMTPYHHRHHIHSTTKRVTKDIDDPGYESGNRKNNRRRQYIDHIISSDTDSDDNSTHVDLSVLNEAYERARKVQHRSQTLSRHISRQLKLVLATI